MNVQSSVTEVGPETWRVESTIGERDLYQYVLRGGAEVLVGDTGMASTPREVLLPALRSLGIVAESVRYIVVMHSDLDHQGGLASLAEAFPQAVRSCGLQDAPMIEDPEILIGERYRAYEAEHGIGYDDASIAWLKREAGSPCRVNVLWSGDDTIRVGSRRLDVLKAPGHSGGHLVLFEPEMGMLLTSDAVHGRFCPSHHGSPALPPTYEEPTAYLETIERLERLRPVSMHTGHWPSMSTAEIRAFFAESREFVEALRRCLLERLNSSATVRDLCEYADRALGPLGGSPGSIDLVYAVCGHLRELERDGLAVANREVHPTQFVRSNEGQGR